MNLNELKCPNCNGVIDFDASNQKGKCPFCGSKFKPSAPVETSVTINKKVSFLGNFSILDLMIIAVLAALGIAVGGIVGPLVRLITGPLMLPGGSVAGGIYMLFLVMCVSLTGKKTAALLCGIVQAIIVYVTGFGGHHGALTILTYSAPGAAVLVLLLILRHKGCCKLCMFFAGMIANLTGTFLVSAGVMALPLVPLLLGLTLAAVSGGLGGLLGHSLTVQIKKLEVLK
ncbi:MAG: ECF transporter S component [Defluviitaleaceae bacterium]|nr:ECF transporter S component [Defluviitaleaceae bacterium]